MIHAHFARPLHPRARLCQRLSHGGLDAGLGRHERVCEARLHGLHALPHGRALLVQRARVWHGCLWGPLT